jgi:tRNA threonylcarbamoyladenosine biosynthesis protein TsaE
MSYHSVQIITYSAAATQALGQQLGETLRPGQVVALSGDLGAGKTTFTQGIGRGLGVRERITSPTFTLVNEYVGRDGITLIHTDSYRLGEMTNPLSDGESASQEAATFGMDEILDRPDAVIVIEWAERLKSLLPDDYLEVRLAHLPNDEESREIAFLPHGPRAAESVNRITAAHPQPA